jgi:monolysocardiolipin acyltransferase
MHIIPCEYMTANAKAIINLGLDAIMPEPRQNPRWFPRPGAEVTITFGEAINEKMDPMIDRLSRYSSEGDQGQTDDTAETILHGLDTLSPRYPSPSANLFPPITPLMKPPGGAVAWPVPLSESRSAKAIERKGDTPRARLARSLIAAELRAHLLKLGEEQGKSLTLVHRLMDE